MLYSFLIENAVLPAIGLLTASQFWQLAESARETERRPAGEIEASQWEATRWLLEHAFEHVALYRERVAGASLSLGDFQGPHDLAKLPSLSRSAIAANFPDRVTAGGGADDWRFAATSGTTAQRLVVVQNFGKRDAVRAAAAHSYRFAGQPLGSRTTEIPPDVCTARCGIGRGVEPTLRDLLRDLRRLGWRDGDVRSAARGLAERRMIFRRTVLPSFDGRGTAQPDDSFAAVIGRIRDLRPAVLKALPAYLLGMARHLERGGGAKLLLHEIRPMGAALAPSVRRVIAEGFGSDVLEDYGTAELGSIGCECAPGRGLHLFTTFFHLEFVRGGRSVAPGEVGRILVTDLSNRAMPFIRYEVGDVGMPIAGACPCGRATPRFRVLGRLDYSLVSPNGRIFTEHGVTDFLLGRPDVEWFQLIERPGWSFELRVVPRPGAAGPPGDLGGSLADFLGDHARVRIREVGAITPETGGKFRFVKSVSSARFDE